MSDVVSLTDQNELALTNSYKHAKWAFDHFNPVQSRVLEICHEDVNIIVAAKTSAGKTVIAEMFIAQEIKERGGKGLFLAPLRALAQEKIDQWCDPDYHFSNLNISICTGDYRITPQRQKELEDSNIIIMTSEMLNHRARNMNSEKSKYLEDIGTLVVDESHLLTVPGRGEHLEVGLMKFCKINPKCRIVFLSATMPNVAQIAEWMAGSLNKKKTYVLDSSYRPVPLGIHYENYDDDASYYDAIERNKVDKAMDIILDYPEDKFLVFSHTKRTGELMTKTLKSNNIGAEFHNADLKKDERVLLEKRFKAAGDLRVVVATPTLAWGVNMPARRVIILGIHRGNELVESYNITQMVGRSGRLGIDPMGDAYILLPNSEARVQMDRLKMPQKIVSKLIENPKNLAFHLVSEIYQGEISNFDDIKKWYERSLAHHQSKHLGDTMLKVLFDDLKKYEIVYENDGVLEVSSVGKVSSIFYCCPFDIASLRRNMYFLFKNGAESNDLKIAVALANTDGNRMLISNTAEKSEIKPFDIKLQRELGQEYKFLTEGSKKAALAYYNLLNGTNSMALAGFQRGIQSDFERLEQVLCALDSMSGKWNKSNFFRELGKRIKHGVPSHLVQLCQIPNIGKMRAKKLWDLGYKNVKDVANEDVTKLRKVLNMKEDLVKQVVSDALGLVSP